MNNARGPYSYIFDLYQIAGGPIPPATQTFLCPLALATLQNTGVSVGLFIVLLPELWQSPHVYKSASLKNQTAELYT